MLAARAFQAIRTAIRSSLQRNNRTIGLTHSYESYDDYMQHQRNKTLDPKRIEKWLGSEWNVKLEGFKDIFSRNSSYLRSGMRAICLGARTGQEVKALQDMGLDAIGIDLVAFPPFTIEGDIHHLAFADGSFDFAFSNIFDHALYPEKFISEIERVLKPGGTAILHLQIGGEVDAFSETVIYHAEPVEKLFSASEMLASRKITNNFDGMNWEIIARKR